MKEWAKIREMLITFFLGDMTRVNRNLDRLRHALDHNPVATVSSNQEVRGISWGGDRFRDSMPVFSVDELECVCETLGIPLVRYDLSPSFAVMDGLAGPMITWSKYDLASPWVRYAMPEEWLTGLVECGVVVKNFNPGVKTPQVKEQE